MKRIRIGPGKIGLLISRDKLKRVLTRGQYWIGLLDVIYEYDLTGALHLSRNLPYSFDLLVKENLLEDFLIKVDVKDGEIVLQYEKDNLKEVLGPGQYAFWKGVKEYRFEKLDLSTIDVPKELDSNILTRRELLPYVRVFEVYSYEKAILIVNGIYEKMLDSGTFYYWKNPTSIFVKKVDTRQLQLEVSGQEMLTKDKAVLRINFNAIYKVVDIEKALVDNKDYEKQLYTLMQLALREFVGTYTLDELLEKKEAIADYVMKTLTNKVVSLGVKLFDCGVKDIILPGEVKDIMNQVLIAQKQAQANVIMRREETASTRSLLNTAKLMEDNDMLFKLKEMEYVEKIADKIGEITVTGNGQVIDQLKGIFAPAK